MMSFNDLPPSFEGGRSFEVTNEKNKTYDDHIDDDRDSVLWRNNFRCNGAY